MKRPALLLVLALIGTGCAERPSEDAPAPDDSPSVEDAHVSYTLRGVFRGALHDGEAASIDHEALEGIMPAMRMDLRVADPALLDGLRPGAPIRFRMEDRGFGFRITEVEPLPPGRDGCRGRRKSGSLDVI